jgi:hypothetical protein
VVVLDYFDKEYLVRLNHACRSKGVGFIYGGNLGLYGFTFVDFGDHHKVIDSTGEQEKSIHIAGITQEPNGLVCLHEDKKHGLSDGDTVQFREVKGMEEINGKEFKITVKSSNSFLIGDTSHFSPYSTGGLAVEIKVPVFLKFWPLERSLNYPYAPDSKEMPICTWEKMGYP